MCANTDLYKERHGTSSVNTYSLTAICAVIKELLQFGYDASSLMLIIYYSAQVKLADRWLRRELGVRI